VPRARKHEFGARTAHARNSKANRGAQTLQAFCRPGSQWCIPPAESYPIKPLR